METKDLISEYRTAASEYLRWLETAKDRFGETPALGAVLEEMWQGANLYGWMSQKGLYDYRTKLDPEIWREICRRYVRQQEQLTAIAEQGHLAEQDRVEWQRIAERLTYYHEALTKAAEDWFYQEDLRRKRKAQKGCLGLFGGTLVVILAPLMWWLY